MKIYISGPMSGLPYFNGPAFMTADERLTSLGHLCFNPAKESIFDVMQCPTGSREEGKKFGFNIRQALKKDLDWIADNADAIALLPGWYEGSKGCKAEVTLGLAIGLRFFSYMTAQPGFLISIRPRAYVS